MNKALWAALAIVVLLAAVFYIWYFLPRGGRPSPDELQQQALAAATPEERQAAAAQLCDWGAAALPQLRGVLAASDSSVIRAMVIQALGQQFDYDSMNTFLTGLSDPSPEVRERSMQAVRTMLGRSVPFDSTAPEAQRSQAIDSMRKDWVELQSSPLLKDFQERQRRGEIAPPGG